MGRSDTAIRRCWQEWVDNDRFQHHDGSDRSRAKTYRKYKVIARSAVIAPDSSLSTIGTRTRVSTMIIHRRLIERNVRSYQQVTPPVTHACTLSIQNTVVLGLIRLGRIVFRDESHFQLCPENVRRCFGRGPGQRVGPVFLISLHTGPQPRVMIWGGISLDS